MLLIVLGGTAQAHTLGVDPADLAEMVDGSYHLVSRVPPRLQPAIRSPELPERCAFEGNPRGTRGVYEVRFIFTCESRLVAGDEINLPWQREGAMMTVTWNGQEPVTRFVGREGPQIKVDLEYFLAGSGGFWAGAKRYTILGVEHILIGIDHLLFVLALLFVVQSGWKLVQTITAFTVAHSITLGLATLGYINMPSAPVEAAIALSIVFLCVEIIHKRRGRPGITYSYPWIVAFAFGLLHGLGFAGALADIGLPPPEIPLALLFFNVGVEIGQLIFVFAVIAVMAVLRYGAGLGRESTAYLHGERAIVYVVGVLASYWLLERSMGIFT
jgi:hydrogenase/urease accessory protein HupE